MLLATMEIYASAHHGNLCFWPPWKNMLLVTIEIYAADHHGNLCFWTPWKSMFADLVNDADVRPLPKLSGALGCSHPHTVRVMATTFLIDLYVQKTRKTVCFVIDERFGL
jgi:hypothetical protein